MALPALQGAQPEPPRSRFVDLALVFVAHSDDAPDHVGEYLFGVGGVWDRDEGKYIAGPDEAESCRIFRVTPAQMPAALQFRAWLEARRRKEPRDVVLFLGGERRSGKSILATALALALALEVPGFPSFLVSGTEHRRGELDRDLARLPGKIHLPAEWYDESASDRAYYLANGSVLQHISAARPANAKQGGASCVLLNEAQELRPRVYGFSLKAIDDTGGLVILACNPPLLGSAGGWVLGVRKAIRKGKVHGSVFQLDPALNPYIDATTRKATTEALVQLDPSMAAADADGAWIEVGNFAYPQWRDDFVIELPEVGLRDVTRTITARRATERSQIIGLDFQGRPYMAAVIWRLYTGVVAYEDEDGRACEAEGTIDAPLWIATGEVVLPKSDDDGLIEELTACGLIRSSLFVGDASGQTQSATHKAGEPESFRAFRAVGALIVPPQKKRTAKSTASANPRVPERLNLAATLMRAPRVFIAGRREGRELVPLAPVLAKSFAKCEIAPSRRASTKVPIGYEAHITDAATYALYWGEADRYSVKAGAEPEAATFREHAPGAGFDSTPRGGFPGLR